MGSLSERPPTRRARKACHLLLPAIPVSELSQEKQQISPSPATDPQSQGSRPLSARLVHADFRCPRNRTRRKRSRQFQSMRGCVQSFSDEGLQDADVRLTRSEYGGATAAEERKISRARREIDRLTRTQGMSSREDRTRRTIGVSRLLTRCRGQWASFSKLAVRRADTPVRRIRGLEPPRPPIPHQFSTGAAPHSAP